MSEENWKGRKYRASTGMLFEILTEPFEWKGKTYVAYGSGSHSDTAYTTAFEADGYERVIEPPLKKGDKFRSSHGDIYTVDAISSRPDDEGDWLCIVINSAGGIDTRYLLAGWAKVDAA